MGNVKIGWALVMTYMVVIFYLSSIPLKFPEIIDVLDPTKFTLHMAEYMILGFLVYRPSKKSNFSFLLSSLYGVSDELHQYFVPFRSFSWLDILADVMGSLLGVVITRWLYKKNFRLLKIIPGG